jgi:hypothetical protein
LANVTNTQLLCCQSGSSATAATVAPGTITAVGDAYATTFTDSKPGNDSLVDTPTNGSQVDTGVGGEVVGNYATLNPLDNGGIDLSNGNLGVSNGAAHEAVRSTIKLPSSGKWYAECTLTSASPGVFAFGIDYSNATNPASYVDSNKAYIAVNATSLLIATDTQYDLTTTTANAILMVAYDSGTQNLWLGFNGNWYTTAFATTGNPANGTNPTAISIPNGFLTVAAYSATGDVNFGQRQWAYAAPAGFKALCTTNLPEPTIADGSTAMDVALYTGNGSTQTISGLNFSPDLVWIKQRSAVRSNWLTDTVRGNTKLLSSDQTAAEITETDCITAFNSDGFNLDADAGFNASAGTYVAWTWDAGSSTVTNTQGSITSQVRANASAGFSVVTFSIASASATISTFGHGLGVAPSFVIFKVRTVADDWTVYHGSISSPTSNWLTLNSTAAAGGATSTFSTSSTTFGVRGTRLLASGTSGDIVAYCFAPVAGYSSFGSYVGNGSASDGPFVYTGFRPRWVMVKYTSGAGGHWMIRDAARNTFNAADEALYANLSGATDTGSTYSCDFLSNGFKVRGDYGSQNISAGTYIYIAFAENPFATSRAR